MTRLVLLANPGTPRAAHFLGAAAERPDVHVTLVPWARLCDTGALVHPEPAVVRIDSPGKDDAVLDRLLVRGGGTARAHAFGEIRSPRFVHEGWLEALAVVERSLAAQPHLAAWVPPAAIATMFDKAATSRVLAQAGLPVPPSIPAPSSVPALWDALADRGSRRAYVKLATGSCAAGIVLLDRGAGPSGRSTVLPRGERMFNTRRLRELRGEALESVLDFLLREGAVVERAIPLAEIDGQPFDLRVIVFDGEPAFTIARQSPYPITNLHLGGRRVALSRVRALVPPRRWLAALDDCVRAASRFDVRAVGIDVLFERGYGRHYLLELNPFGDFFPGWEEAGRAIYPTLLHHLSAFALGRSTSPAAECPRGAAEASRAASRGSRG